MQFTTREFGIQVTIGVSQFIPENASAWAQAEILLATWRWVSSDMTTAASRQDTEPILKIGAKIKAAVLGLAAQNGLEKRAAAAAAYW